MYILILNPISGNGKSANYLEPIEKLLKEKNIEYRVDMTTETLTTAEVAAKAIRDNPEGIIAIGGDGTLFGVINGMIGSDIPLLFVSCGTGNDFVRTLKLPKDPIEALRVQLDSPVRRIDVGRMNEIYFLNVSGTGFDVDVLRNTDKYKDRYTGLSAYMHGLYDAVKSYKPLKAMISVDDAPAKEIECAILSIGNGRYFGGGMRAVPDAIVDDGLFDLIIVEPVKKRHILLLIPFFILGKHVALKLASMQRCRKISIQCKNMTINLDGELRDADSAEYELLPSALNVRVPM